VSVFTAPRIVTVPTPVGDVQVRRTFWREDDGTRRLRWSARPVGGYGWKVHDLLQVALAHAFGYTAPPFPEWLDRVAEQAQAEIGAAV